MVVPPWLARRPGGKRRRGRALCLLPPAAPAPAPLEQETAVQKERARIAKDLHDDLGAHLSQIAMLSELAQSDFDKPAQAKGHIDLIFRTARSVTRSLDEIVWAVNPRNDSLDRFTAHLCTFAPEFLRAAGISCRLDVPMDLPTAPLPAKVRHHLYLGFKEALHNVVKHAGATEVWLRLKVDSRQLTLVIEDNGRGFQRGAGAASGEDGLVNLGQRMSEIGGSFQQQSEPGQGTRTVLVAPLEPEGSESLAPLADPQGHAAASAVLPIVGQGSGCIRVSSDGTC